MLSGPDQVEAEPSAGEVFRRYLEFFKGVGYLVTVVVGAVSLFFAIKSELNTVNVVLTRVEKDVADIKRRGFDSRITSLERQIESLTRNNQRLVERVDRLEDRTYNAARNRRRRSTQE